jgi:hypothetical protein
MTPIVDAWMQHPSLALMADPMFDSLRRWMNDLGLDQEATDLFPFENAARVFELRELSS